MNSWTLTVEEDTETGNCVIQFPDDLLKAAGWKIGDALCWIDQGDGSYQLIKEDLTTFIKKGIIKDDNN